MDNFLPRGVACVGVSFTLLPLVLAACERQPVAPDRAAAPQFQATRSEVTNTIGLVDDPSDCTANPKIGCGRSSKINHDY